MGAETARYEPERDYVRSFLLLRWLLLIVAAYLTLFPSVGRPSFALFYTFVVGFAATNIVCMTVSHTRFKSPSFRLGVMLADAIFVSVTFFLLRAPDTYLFVPFILVFVMAEIWRDLK